jgi:hypothetical protein
MATAKNMTKTGKPHRASGVARAKLRSHHLNRSPASKSPGLFYCPTETEVTNDPMVAIAGVTVPSAPNSLLP